MTLYQISERERCVRFLWNIEEKDIEEDFREVETYRFDSILRQLESFKRSVNVLDNIRLVMNDSFNKSRKDNKEVFDKLSEHAERKNMFFRYFIDTAVSCYKAQWEKFSKPDDVVVAAITKKKSVNSYKKAVNDLFAEIMSVINDERIFDFQTMDVLYIKRVQTEMVVIRGAGENEIFRVADTALENFFFEFSFAVRNLGFEVRECNFCRKHFLGSKEDVCCESEACQAKWRKLKDRHARQERRSNVYTKERDNYNNYVRVLKQDLRKYRASEEDIEAFTNRQAELQAEVKAKLAEWECDDLPISVKFITERKREMKEMHDRIVAEKLEKP